MAEISALGAMPALSPVAPARPVASGDASPLPQAATPASSASATTTGQDGGSSLSIDPALGITVLKFFSSAGDLTQSFPSQRQLQSYQIYGFDRGTDNAATRVSV